MLAQRHLKKSITSSATNTDTIRGPMLSACTHQHVMPGTKQPQQEKMPQQQHVSHHLTQLIWEPDPHITTSPPDCRQPTASANRGLQSIQV
jgi:hypothetical protein